MRLGTLCVTMDATQGVSTPKVSSYERAALAALLAVVWLVYAPLLAGEFVYDDKVVVLQNPLLTSWANLPQVFSSGMWDFADADTARSTAYWRPLSSLLLMTSWSIGGADPFVFHCLSLALHLAATAAAWALARTWSGNAYTAWIAALLWAFHPTHVESVAWISAVSDPAFAMCAFLSLRAVAIAHQRERTPWSAGAWLLAGLLCKELALAVVPVAICWSLCASRSHKLRSLQRLWLPFGLALLVWWAGRALAFGEWTAGFTRTTTGFGVAEARLWQLRAELLAGGTQLAWWPQPLQLFRPFSPELAWSALALPMAVLAGVAAAAWMCIRRQAYLTATALLFTPLALLPLVGRVEALGLFPLSDRYLYLASFGVALSVALVLSSVSGRMRWLSAGLALALCAPLAWSTRERIAVWSNEQVLFTQASAESPRAPYAQWQLGRVELERYRASGDVRALRASQAAFDRAMDLLAAAKRGDGTLFATGEDFLQTNVGYAWALIHEAEIDAYHDYDTPAGIFRTVLDRKSDAEEAWTGLGVALMLSNDFDGARNALERALQANPRYAEAHENLGLLLARKGDVAAARASFEAALALRPGNVRTQLRLAGMLERAGEPQAALQLIEQVVRDHARDPRPMVARSQLKAAGGDLPAALLDADAAITLNNESGDAHLARARILAVRGETNAALVSARRACDLLPSNFDAHYLAAALHGQLGETYAAVPYLVRAWTSRGSSAKPVEAALERALDEYEALSATSLVAMARADGDRNDAARALKWADRAAARYPAEAEVARTRAELLRRFERTNEALAEWQRVCSLDLKDPYAAEACAKLQLDMGDVEGAKESLRAALQRAQSLPDLKERRATTQRIEVALARL